MPETRHILNLSGGKDSTALAIYMRDRVPNLEYVFCDTGKELPETYDYLNKVEAYLGAPIVRLNADYSFDHYLDMFSGFLPSAQMRWCTRDLKLKPFEKFVGDDPVMSYVGIRADEQRDGYISRKPNITAVFPFKEDGITKADVFRMLDEAGLGLPEYYEWRTRSGCYFCFFQRKAEWVGLKENHPDLFEKAKAYEKADTPSGKRYTWSPKESLDEIEARGDQIKAAYAVTLERMSKQTKNKPLMELFDDAQAEDDGYDDACLMCDL
jgi:3'-phosphoadenosine 5'-phosphosulfate sulfotransferase (PAPS reductase)/FAD synthetase